MPKKKHNKKSSFFSSLNKNLGFEKMTLIIIISLIFLGAAGAVQTISQSEHTSNSTSNSPQLNSTPVPFPTTDTSATNRQLQLNSFQITNTPIPTSPPIQQSQLQHKTEQPACGIDDGQQMPDSCTCDAYTVTCKSGQCVDFKVNQTNADILGPKDCSVTWCSDGHAPSGDGTYCLGKPIIYLYPQKGTMVSVSIKTPGNVVISNPHYPENGWNNILAHPNGTFEYNQRSYRELYYETSVQNVEAPKQGILIPSDHLNESLRVITTKLGLTEFERNEFLDYWVPKLEKLNSPYILFSLLTHEEKNRVDHVNITPEPDTRIEFIAYFKPLEKPVVVEPLSLPLEIPKRTGFTIVEWGGTIEENKGSIF